MGNCSRPIPLIGINLKFCTCIQCFMQLNFCRPEARMTTISIFSLKICKLASSDPEHTMPQFLHPCPSLTIHSAKAICCICLQKDWRSLRKQLWTALKTPQMGFNSKLRHLHFEIYIISKVLWLSVELKELFSCPDSICFKASPNTSSTRNTATVENFYKNSKSKTNSHNKAGFQRPKWGGVLWLP